MARRLLKAVAVGAVLGVVLEYIISPYITKPIKKKVEEII